MTRILSALVVATAAITASAMPAVAQSSLGFTAAEFDLGMTDSDDLMASAMVDIAITQYHGAQFNVGLSEQTNGAIASVAGHLYMTPQDGHKYGLSLLFSDVDNASISYAQIGAAGMVDLNDVMVLEVSGAMGMVMDNDLDWITTGAGLHWQARDDLRVYGAYNITEFDEAGFYALAQDATVGARYLPNQGAFGVYAEASHDWLSGDNSAAGETTLELGITLSLGATGGDKPAFTVFDPIRQIQRRGLY